MRDRLRLFFSSLTNINDKEEGSFFFVIIAPLVLAALIKAGVATGKAIHGGIQAKKAKKRLESLERPKYMQSRMLQENLRQAQIQSQQGLPSAAYQAGQQQIERAGSSALQAAQSLGGGTAGLGGIVQAQTGAFSNLISQDALARERQRQNLMRARTAMSGEEKTAFQINQLAPYQQQVASEQAMMGAGMQNLYGGLEEMGSTAMQMAAAKSGGGVNSGSGISPEDQAKWDQLTPEQQAEIMKTAQMMATQTPGG